MAVVKQVGSSGQITLGKKYAGKIVQLVEEEETGKITLLFGQFVPAREAWIHKEPHRSKLDKAIRHAEKNPPKETNLNTLK